MKWSELGSYFGRWGMEEHLFAYLNAQQLEDLQQEAEFVTLKLTEIIDSGMGIELNQPHHMWTARFESVTSEISERRSPSGLGGGKCIAITSRGYSCSRVAKRQFYGEFYNIVLCQIHSDFFERGKTLNFLHGCKITRGQPVEIKKSWK